MIKGFINYCNVRIPYVIEDYVMELFTDDPILKDFSKDNNHKKNYILKGLYFTASGFQPQRITALVDYSMGNTCYLLCYLLESMGSTGEFDCVGFQSTFLDDVFRYRYEYLEFVRAGVNLASSPRNVYTIPFDLEGNSYELTYKIGQNESMGLLDDIEKKGEAIVPLKTGSLEECYILSRVLQRSVAFFMSRMDVSFKRVALYRNELPTGWFYSKLVSEEAVSCEDMLFYDFDVMKYVPKVINNIALNPKNIITKSIPLGHLAYAEIPHTPQRFIEQITAFEYLFEKLEPKKAKDKTIPLKMELKEMLDLFSDVFSESRISADEISQELKEVRRKIAHGYVYYYDFGNNSRLQYMTNRLDTLIKAMSLKLMGFSQNEIKEYPRLYI